MEYIFEHEQLRIDEIMKRVSAKNNFTPLKPLKRTNLNLRRNTIEPKPKPVNKTPRSVISRVKEESLLSPLTSSIFYIPKQRPKHESADMIIYNNTDCSMRAFSNCVKPLQSEKNESNSMLPVINRGLPAPESKLLKNRNENLRKNSQSLIAYIPSVSFITDTDENKNRGIVKKHTNSYEITFLQNKRYLKKYLK